VTAWAAARRRARSALEGESAETAQSGSESVEKAPAPIEVLLGGELSAAWQGMKPLLGERVSALRTQQEKMSGFAIPAVLIQDGAQLGAFAYEISLFGARHARGELRPDRTLAIGAPSSGERPPGEEARDPAFGLPALWIDAAHRDQAQRAGYTLVDPVTVLMTHLGEVLRGEAALLLTRGDVVAMLEGVRGRQIGLIEELVPNVMTVSDVQRVLQNLLAEEVSIRNVDLIVEALVDVGRSCKDHFDLTEMVRQRLSHVICHGLRAGREQLEVLSLHPRIEGQVTEQLRGGNGAGALVIEPRLAEQLILGLAPLAEKMMRDGLTPVLLCGPEVRRHLKTFTRRTLPRLAVISVNEVPHNVELKSFAVLSPEDAGQGKLPALS
jgi:flagellar biosynthesis protein FlhA